MTVYEVLTVALIVVLALATIAAIYLGLMNWIGAVYVVRCAACHHQTFASANQPQPSCPHCRHPALMHPIYAKRHSGARIVADRLHY